MLITDTKTQSILEKLSRENTNLLLVAEHTRIDIKDIIKRCNEENITIAGGIFPMIINDVSSLESGVILKVLPQVSDLYLVKDIDQLSIGDLPELPEGIKSSIVLLDGLSPSIPKFLNTLYDKYWNQISYVGGGAGSLTLEQKPCVFTNEGLYENAGLILFSEKSTQLGVKHGWQKIAGPYIANKTEGNRVIELNWKPAFDIYKEIVELHTDQRFENNNFFDIAKGFPFGIYREGQEDIVRDPISVGEDGSLICVGAIEPNTSLNILKGKIDQLIENASEAAKLAKIDGVSDILVSDCISRILYLGDDFPRELEAVKKAMIDNGSSLEGILSIGEVSSGVNGYLELYNKTIVVSSFY